MKAQQTLHDLGIFRKRVILELQIIAIRAKELSHCQGLLLRRLILSRRHGLDAAAVNLSEISGIVDGKSDKCRPQAVAVAHPDSEQIVGAEIYYHQLKHQGRSPHNRNIKFHRCP